MATTIKLRRGTTAQHSTFTGSEGEVTINTTKDTAVVHDGSTAGGFELARADVNNVNNPQFNGTSSLKVPVGTSAQRPASPSNGQIRYNTGSHRAEVYANGTWRELNEMAYTGYDVNRYACRGWINFGYDSSSSSLVISGSANVHSVVRNGQGDYTVKWDELFDGNECIVFGGDIDTTGGTPLRWGFQNVTSAIDNDGTRSTVRGVFATGNGTSNGSNIDTPIVCAAIFR